MKITWRECPRRSSPPSEPSIESVVVAVVEPAMVAAGAFAARDTGFLRTPGWPTRKLIWANWGAPERSNRKRDRCSVQAAAELGFYGKWDQPWDPPFGVVTTSKPHGNHASCLGQQFCNKVGICVVPACTCAQKKFGY